jgi:type II secretory pathway component GspD/PulD (secretin)
MRGTFFIVACILFAAGSVLYAETAPNRFEAYPLGSADPLAMRDIVTAIVGDDGTVVIDERNNRLLVVATSEEHERIGRVMNKTAVITKNVRIEVQFNEIGSSSQSGIGVEGSGGVVITEKGASTTIRLKPRLEHRTTEFSSNVSQMLLVGSGREATLQVGERVPYLEWIMDYGIHWGVLHKRVNWQEVGSRLIVKPTILGEGPMIRIELIPELSGLVDGNPYHVRFTRAATEIVARDGETIQIGGQNEDQDFFSRFLVGFDRAAGTKQLQITLTPRISGGGM